MSRCCFLVACLVLGGIPAPSVHACSSFSLAGTDEVLLAKNFDWHFGGGYLIKNPSGVTRRALPLFGGEPASWTSVHGSLTFTQYGAGLPYGGINQRGLAIEMLWLDETVYPAAAPTTIGELEWIQYQLDTRATVAEVVAGLEEFSIRPVGGKIHYMLADPSGDRALVEFVDGAARVTIAAATGALVCTNDTQKLSELAFAKLRATPLEGNSSRVRYARLRRDLDALDRPPSVARAFPALDGVAERGGRYRTQWSAVYELRSRRVHVKPDEAKRAFAIDAAALDYGRRRAGRRSRTCPGRSPATAGSPRSPTAAQRALLGRNLPKVGLNDQLDAIAGHLLDAPPRPRCVRSPIARHCGSACAIRRSPAGSPGSPCSAVQRELARQQDRACRFGVARRRRSGSSRSTTSPRDVRGGRVPRSQSGRPARRRRAAGVFPPEPRSRWNRLRRPGIRAGRTVTVGHNHARVAGARAVHGRR